MSVAHLLYLAIFSSLSTKVLFELSVSKKDLVYCKLSHRENRMSVCVENIKSGLNCFLSGLLLLQKFANVLLKSGKEKLQQ